MSQLSYQCRNLYQSACDYLQKGMLREAALTCKDLCEKFPAFSAGWYTGSKIALQLGNSGKAIEYIDKAIALEPDKDVYIVHKATSLLSLRRQTEANALIGDILRREPGDPETRYALAFFYLNAGDYEQSREHFRFLTDSIPEQPAGWFNLAATERFLGNLDASEKAYNEGLRLQPGNYEAYYIRAGLRRQTPKNNHISEMEHVLSQGKPEWIGEVQICYALAKECEDIEEYDKSFSYLKRGADLRRSHMKYNVENDLNTIDQIIDTCSGRLFENPGSGDPSLEPIFIIGLPRTGTTLVERILASHRDVNTAGELNDFAIELTKAIRSLNNGQPQNRAEEIAASTRIDFRQLGENYLASARSHIDDASYFIDKMPLNYLYCGLITLALPNAKIIELTRHPVDTCYSIYKQFFTMAYPFSYDLYDLGRYYLAYTRLMEHWHRILPGRIHRIQYEQLVVDQELETRRLLEYCGLPWDDACMAFESNPHASTTASAAQVRQTVYRTSVGKWKHYEQQLKPLTDLLAENGIEI